MSLHVSSPFEGGIHKSTGFQVKSFDLHKRGEHTSPIITFDDFRVTGNPFGPHPHAGFSAVTYVLQDSTGGLRSRDSLGNDIRVGPGGIVWAQAGEGMIHHETPENAERELHGVQFFVNHRAINKLITPEVLWMKNEDIPQWVTEKGDLVKVIVGQYKNITSPLKPIEPFRMLDARINSILELEINHSNFGLLYVLHGSVNLHSDTSSSVKSGQAVTLSGEGKLIVEANPTAQILFLEGMALNEPIVTHGPFIMNDRTQIKNAMKRFEAGEMGRLA